MRIYRFSDMVLRKDIIEINKQLQKFGSKVSQKLLDDKQEHILANVMSLACGEETETTYGISLDKINSIKSNEFEIQCDCRHSTFKETVLR